ncbi:integrase core domain-containing protein [Cellvibrio japonicus]|uniref:Integrase core domain protein n=1 Tax=Cellvibrio japonicus (strain Ueda107) TaxID=498211 RepID=B3PFL2_CELJU|nr:integrase core domain-containing protein [Cellvibrio japonicus]ACE83906.1 Integrase core domain protein [Cellvibrio japonicus Ueda107]
MTVVSIRIFIEAAWLIWIQQKTVFLKHLRLLGLLIKRQKPLFRAKQKIKSTEKQSIIIVKRQRKPAWVKQEIIRLKAFMVHDGCRKVADAFNRLYREKQDMSVSKTYTATIIQKHAKEILLLRKTLRNRTPRPLPKNLVWSMDLTYVNDDEHIPQTILGIVDSGTRLCLQLEPIPGKASATLLRYLLDTVEKYGKPNLVNTDNEPVFTSKLFRFGLWLLQIKHQRSEVCCPWMNGKIERFFGTLKQKLKHYTPGFTENLSTDLDTFRFWYNHIRTHQNLNGLTPFEVWKNTTPHTGKPLMFSAWDGALTGIYFSPP